MQFEGKLKFLFGQKKKASSGTMVPPQMALFCIAVPLLLPPVTEMKMKSVLMRTQKKPGAASNTENTAKAFPSVCEVEQHERNGHQATCFPNVLHSTENQIKLMNTGDNGISLLKVQANEDQWVWVEANSNLLYRNGGTDYMVLAQQAQREDEQQVKKQSGMLGIKGSREARMCNETPAHLKHHLIWGKQEKEDAKVKYQPSKGNTFLQEENNLFPKHFSTVQNHCNASSGWSMKNSSGSRPGHQLIGSFSNRTSRPFYGLDQSHSGVHMVGRHLRGGAEHFQPYPGVQPHSMDSFNADNIKLESAFLSPEVLYDSGLPLNIPIKIENDSDSESRPELYSEHPGQSWIGDNTILKKQLLDFPEGLHLKTETDYNEQTLCIKPKHHMHPPHRGHCFVPATHINHINASRPFKGIYNKEAAQFCPQKCAYLESMLNLQGGDCLSNQFYAASSTDDKNQGDQSYKLQCEFKTHSLVQNIKREPLDSPPWPDSEQEAVQAIYQKNTLMGFLPSQMSRNAAEFAYIQ